jgi:hypothetical protein
LVSTIEQRAAGLAGRSASGLPERRVSNYAIWKALHLLHVHGHANLKDAFCGWLSKRHAPAVGALDRR